MKFAEFEAGQVLEAGPYRVEAQDIVEFAQQWDPQWFHTQPQAALHSPFGGLIASGWHTCSIAMRLVAEAFLTGSESFASPGLNYIKWPAPVRPDDALMLKATVLEARPSRKGLGVLRWRWQLHNQQGIEVLDLEVTSLFKI